MQILIRSLTPDLINDYLNFFDNVAFTDHPEWSQCYCIHFHWRPEWDSEPPVKNRDRVISHINDGSIRGYLAYAGGNAIGWCSADDRRAYAGLAGRENDLNDADKKIKAVVCFLVAPDMRGKGVATELLARACADAEREGFDFIEVYPPVGGCDMYAAHHGTVALYEKFGFVVHERTEGDCVMRRYFSNKR